MHHYDSIWADPRTWVGVAFLIFFVIFGRKIWVVVAGILDKRAADIRAELAAAARLRSEAEALLAEARLQRQAALKDAEALLANAQLEAARVAETAREEATASAGRRERMAMDRIGAAEKAAVTEVRLAAADVASRAAAQVLSQGFGPEQDAALVDRAIQGLPAALAGRRAA